MTGRIIRCNCTVLATCEDLICETSGGCFKSLTRYKDSNEVYVDYKCVDYIPKDRPFKCYNDKRRLTYHTVQCCNDNDFCAQHLHLQLERDDMKIDNPTEKEPHEGHNFWRTGLIACSLISLFLIMLLLYFYIKFRQKRRNLRHVSRAGSSERLPLDEQRDLVRVHIANEIQKESIIGRGKFGTVYRCEWKSQFIAVKIFQSFHRDAWSREEEIYMTPLFRHKNILHFIASDTLETGLGVELWLVTRYYERGSLLEFLNANTISPSQLASLAKCIAVGLEFLHDEVCGITSSKPGIAHRDLKSSNIMVDASGCHCCIGDFGTAARFYSSTGVLDVPNSQIFGTKRYLSPEILKGSINVNNFDSLRQVDIYALALIFWELYWRTEIFGRSNPYELPYFDSVPADPSLEDMYTCVYIKKIRPKFIDYSIDSEILINFEEIIKECWTENPSSRLPALRIVKKLGDTVN